MHGHPWCFPYGGAESKDHGNQRRTAVREACEETCYALGLPEEIYSKYFRGKSPRQFGGAYLVDLGFMTEADRHTVIKIHLDNRNGSGLKKTLGRKPTGCEREMIQLKWCDGATFLKHAGGSIPGFGQVRGFCAHIMRKMATSHSFSKWCRASNSGVSSGPTSSHAQASIRSVQSPRCPKGHELVDYVTRGNCCKDCGTHFHQGSHVLNCWPCAWWVCRECYKLRQGSAEGKPQAAATAEDTQDLQEWSDEEYDEEYEMFVNALCLSLGQDHCKITDEEDEMITLALCESLSNQSAVQGSSLDQGDLKSADAEDEMLAIAVRKSLEYHGAVPGAFNYASPSKRMKM